MKSGTSFFNSAVYKKTLLRSWPLWSAYILLGLLILPLGLLYTMETGDTLSMAERVLNSTVHEYTLLVFVMAAAAAMMSFGWMYSGRSTNFICALPVSRTALYGTGLASGLTMLLGGNLVIFLVTLITESLYGCVDLPGLLQWLGWLSLCGIHFYGFAALCAVLTGQLWILPAVYAILQFTAAAVEMLVRNILYELVWGMGESGSVLMPLSPVVQLTSQYPTMIRDEAMLTVGWRLQGWGWPLGYALAGILLAWLGLRLFRRRKMEAAGDTVAVPVLKPVFRWCLALAGALIAGNILVMAAVSPFGGGGGTGDALLVLAALLAGGFAGWFAADMLMMKTVRVFRSHWKGWICFSLILSALLLSAEFDLFGYERRLPAAEDTDSVWIMVSGDNAELKEPDNIGEVLAVHEQLIGHKAQHQQRRDPYSSPSERVRIDYMLKNGKILSRSYQVSRDSETAAGDTAELQRLLNLPESILFRKQTVIPIREDTVTYFAAYWDYGGGGSVEFTPAEAEELYRDCILPDMKDGTIGLSALDSNDPAYGQTFYDLRIQMDLRQPRTEDRLTPETAVREYALTESAAETAYMYDYFYTTPTVHSLRTNEWLREHGIELVTLEERWNEERG